MGVGAGLYMYDVVVKSLLSLSHLLMSSCLFYLFCYLCAADCIFSANKDYHKRRCGRKLSQKLNFEIIILFAKYVPVMKKWPTAEENDVDKLGE